MTLVNKLRTLLTLTRMNLGNMFQTVNTWRLWRIVWAVSTCFRSYFQYCQRLYLCICFTSTRVHLPWLIYCSIHLIWKPHNSKLNSVIPQYECATISSLKITFTKSPLQYPSSTVSVNPYSCICSFPSDLILILLWKRRRSILTHDMVAFRDTPL